MVSSLIKRCVALHRVGWAKSLFGGLSRPGPRNGSSKRNREKSLGDGRENFACVSPALSFFLSLTLSLSLVLSL